jgi:hypothetical protein
MGRAERDTAKDTDSERHGTHGHHCHQPARDPKKISRITVKTGQKPDWSHHSVAKVKQNQQD